MARGVDADYNGPMALCECGCGKDAGVYRKRGKIGQPRRFIHGHNKSRLGRGVPLLDRAMAKIVVLDNGCWLWTGYVFASTGYGGIKVAGDKLQLAHRVVYELLRGPIPEGLQIDHLCRERRCVNPTHLEPVTASENLLRGYAARRAGAPSSAPIRKRG